MYPTKWIDRIFRRYSIKSTIQPEPSEVVSILRPFSRTIGSTFHEFRVRDQRSRVNIQQEHRSCHFSIEPPSLSIFLFVLSTMRAPEPCPLSQSTSSWLWGRVDACVATGSLAWNRYTDVRPMIRNYHSPRTPISFLFNTFPHTFPWIFVPPSRPPWFLKRIIEFHSVTAEGTKQDGSTVDIQILSAIYSVYSRGCNFPRS